MTVVFFCPGWPYGDTLSCNRIPGTIQGLASVLVVHGAVILEELEEEEEEELVVLRNKKCLVSL